MNAHDVIESYVSDVAVQLPRKQRNDVAFELRALLLEELQEKANNLGQVADTAMALELLTAFGHPNEVARRYQTSLIIIDPADGQQFLRLTLLGLVIIWALGLLVHLSQPIESGTVLLQILTHWWGNIVIPSLWWPGVLVVSFGMSTWVRQQWLQASVWKPRTQDRIMGGRSTQTLALFGIVFGLYILMEPRWILDAIWGGKTAPIAYTALTYSESFLQKQGYLLFALVATNFPIFFTVIIQGRRTLTMQHIETIVALATCAVMAWAIIDGPIMMTSNSDQAAKLIMALITVFTLILMVMKWLGKVKPRPSP